jgi:hypothetical protein
MIDRFLRKHENSRWLDIVGSIIRAWLILWVIIFCGYLILAFFGQLPSLPSHDVPSVPPEVPSPFNNG